MKSPRQERFCYSPVLLLDVTPKNSFRIGVEIPFDNISLSDQVKRTIGAIQKGTETLYEPAFKYDDVFVKVDILHKRETGWTIYEVKNSTEVKDYHLDDVAVQLYVLKGSGLPVTKVYLVYLNRDYVRYGDIAVEKLFIMQDLTDFVLSKQNSVANALKEMKEMLRGEMPKIDIGEQCSNPYDCDFLGYCWQYIPEDSIFSIRGGLANKFDLYRQGIIHIKDVPREILSRPQLIQLDGTLKKENFIDKEKIKEFLDTLWYPLCFLDFETTYMVPIPMFDGTRPHQPIPFQYSLHIVPKKDAEPGHHEYLAPPKVDPRRDLIEKLLKEIPENACVAAFNKAYEGRILGYLKDWFPEYGDQIDNITNNLRDLMIPFRDKDFYHWEMQGSYSLKTVLPVLVPELSYEGMEISDGEMASNAYPRMWELEDEAKINKIRQALLEYCKLDTLGMVKILEKLRGV